MINFHSKRTSQYNTANWLINMLQITSLFVYIRSSSRVICQPYAYNNFYYLIRMLIEIFRYLHTFGFLSLCFHAYLPFDCLLIVDVIGNKSSSEKPIDYIFFRNLYRCNFVLDLFWNTLRIDLRWWEGWYRIYFFTLFFAESAPPPHSTNQHPEYLAMRVN